MYEGPVQNLIDELGKLPGIGPKSAQRLAFHMLQSDPTEVERLQGALQAIRDGVAYCEVCGTVAAADRCRICSDPRRDAALVCVVEEPKDIEAIERTREFAGVYHVLGGSLDPLNGIGPGELRIADLLRRVGQTVDGVEVSEIIIATDPNTTGEATSTYLVRLLRDFPGLVVSRLASGLPMGADLEFADELTLGNALSGRRVLSDGSGRQPGRGAVTPPEAAAPGETEAAGDADSPDEAEAPDKARAPDKAGAGESAGSDEPLGSDEPRQPSGRTSVVGGDGEQPRRIIVQDGS